MAKYNITEKREKKAVYRTMINQQLMEQLRDKILKAVSMQKKYRDKHFTARRLAEELGTNTRYVSAVVNLCFKRNYTSFVNGYRIEEAKTVLTDPEALQLTMADISDMVGFSNRQSFYASFYRMTGMTPREYRRKHMPEGQQTDCGTKEESLAQD